MSGGITNRGSNVPGTINQDAASGSTTPPGNEPGGLPPVVIPGQTASVPLGPNAKPLPGVPTPLGTTGPAKLGKPTVPVFTTDSVERGDTDNFHVSLGTPPALPESESLLANTGGQSNFKAFTGQATAIKDLISQPGVLGQISARAQNYIANPGQSVLLKIFSQPTNSNVTSEISANLQATANDIGQNLPPALQPAFQQMMAAAANSPIGKNPVTLAAFAEASADYLICMAAALNTTDGQKNKDFFGQVLSTSQAGETAKEGQIDSVMTSSAEKTQSQKDEQAAADRNKVWNIVLAVVMIVVAVVLAVVAVITCFTGIGEAVGAMAVLMVVAAVAACTMAVITIIQNLPVLLEACGVNCDGFKSLLAGPFGKFLQILSYVCIACELLYAGVGIAQAATGVASAAATAATEATSSVTEAAADAASEAAATAALDATTDATVDVAGAAADAATQAAQSAAAEVVSNVVADTTAQVAAGTMTQAVADAVQAAAKGAANAAAEAVANSASQIGTAAATSAVQSVAAGATDTADIADSAYEAVDTVATTATATSKTAVTVLNGTAQVLGAGAKIAGGFNQMSEAQINFQIAELGADVQQMQAQLKLVQTELQSNQDQTKNVEDELKEVMTLAQNIMQKLFSAMNSQSDIVQTVGAFGKKG